MHNWLAAEPVPTFSRRSVAYQSVVMPVRAPSATASASRERTLSARRSVADPSVVLPARAPNVTASRERTLSARRSVAGGGAERQKRRSWFQSGDDAQEQEGERERQRAMSLQQLTALPLPAPPRPPFFSRTSSASSTSSSGLSIHSAPGAFAQPRTIDFADEPLSPLQSPAQSPAPSPFASVTTFKSEKGASDAELGVCADSRGRRRDASVWGWARGKWAQKSGASKPKSKPRFAAKSCCAPRSEDSHSSSSSTAAVSAPAPHTHAKSARPGLWRKLTGTFAGEKKRR